MSYAKTLVHIGIHQRKHHDWHIRLSLPLLGRVALVRTRGHLFSLQKMQPGAKRKAHPRRSRWALGNNSSNLKF